MPTISLSSYTIRIRDSKGQGLQVDCFYSGQDLLPVLHAYLKGLQTSIYHNPNQRFVLRVPRLERHGRFLHGRIEKGEYGIESEILNTKSKKISYERVSLDAELLPYYFLLAVPKDAKEAIAIFQMSGGLGIKNDFEDHFGDYFSKKFPGLSVEINRLMPAQFAEQFLQRGRVTQIRFIRHGIRRDIAEMVSLGPKEYEGVVELRVKAKRGQTFKLGERIEEVVNRERNVNEFMEVEDFPYDDVKVQLAVNGKYHMLNLGHLDSFRAQYDITKEVGTGGRSPSYTRMKELATKLCEDIAKGMALEFE